MKLPDPSKIAAPGAEAAPASQCATYPDEAGFRQRARLIVEGLAKEDLAKWRKGYFTGGDPGKYLPGAAMAKQLLNEKDPMALEYMNDNRSAGERYHFAVVNWGRYVPLFGHTMLPDKLARAARVENNWLHTTGTENHQVMWRAATVVLSSYRDAQKVQGKSWLKEYVRNLYHYGQGEWDSSTYLMFDLNGFLNIYDFSKDEECRLLAKAALDWFVTAYALKYVNGMHTGPKERGWTDRAVASITDETGWLWWGSTAAVGEEQARNFRYAMHAVTSGYRPNAVLCRIAQRQLPKLPFESRDSKPNYWQGLDGPPQKPAGGVSQESLYVARDYTLGTMWYSEDTCTQLTRLQLGAATPEGAVAFTGCAPGSYDNGTDVSPRYTAGQGTHIRRPSMKVVPQTVALYVQYAQAGPLVVCMAAFPPEAKEKFTYFTTPVKAERTGAWYVMQAGRTFVAVRPLTPSAEETTLGKLPALKFPGEKSGFILQTGSQERYQTAGDFAAAVAALPLDLSDWDRNLRVVGRTQEDRAFVMQYRPGQKHAAVELDDQPVRFENWPVYDGPYVRQKDGVLAVNDGREGFVVDFSGNAPVYKVWKP